MAYERINWENTPSTKTPISAENLNKMDAAIADLYEKGGGSADFGTSSFKSLKLIAQTFNADDDSDAVYVFDSDGLTYADDFEAAAKYEQGNRPRQLIVCYGDSEKTTYQRMLVKGGKDNPAIVKTGSTITVTVDKTWKLDLTSLLNKTPDFWNYAILKNNIGQPFGNYEIKDVDKVANLSKEGFAFKDGATASGFGTLALAPFANAAGQGNTVTVRRGAALAGEGNQVFNWASTAVGAYNNVYGGMSFAGGANANILAYNGVNFGQGSGYYNPMKPDGTMKTFAEILKDRNSIVDGTILNINFGQGTFVAGQGNIAGGLLSAIFGSNNTSSEAASSSLTLGASNFNQAANSLVLGYANENHVRSALVLGEGVVNKDYLLAVGKNFGVTPEGWVKAVAYVGNGDDLTTTNDVVASVPQKAINPVFKEYSDTSLVSVNTDIGSSLAKAVVGTNYQNKATYWHSKYDVVDGQPIPNPVLTEDNPYVITFLIDDSFIPKDNLVIRYYPRQETGSVRTYPTKIKINDSWDRFSKTYVLTDIDYQTQKDDYGYYYDFVISIPSDRPLVGLSTIDFNILELTLKTSDYPLGKFACAQGIRLGYCESAIPLVPVKTDGYYKLSEKIKRVNSINEGAYYTTDQLIGLIKNNAPIPDNIEVNKISFSVTTVAEQDEYNTFTDTKFDIYGRDGFLINSAYYNVPAMNISSTGGVDLYAGATGGGSYGVRIVNSDNEKEIIDVVRQDHTDDKDITKWTSDTELKNKSVVSAVYDNYQKAKLLQKNTSTGYYELSQSLMGPGGNLFVELGMYGKIDIPMGYYGENGDFHNIQFSSSNITSPKWIDGTNTITLYTADTEDSSGKEFKNFHTALNGKSIFAKLTDLINNSGSVPKNVVTTDMANQPNGYAALDENKAITVEKIIFPSSFARGDSDSPSETTITKSGLEVFDKNGFDIKGGFSGATYIHIPFNEAPMELRISDNESIVLTDTNGDNKITLATESEIQSWNKYNTVLGAIVKNETNLSELATEVDNKQNKIAWGMNIPTNNIFTMENNKEFYCMGKGAIASMTLDFKPAGLDGTPVYNSYISFESGETPTVITVTDSSGDGTKVVFKGEDCDASGVFTPVANKYYEIAFKCVGVKDSNFYIVGRVGSC